MDLNSAFGQALRRQRKARGLSQEAFTNVSSRTYLSELERGLKNPTLDKIEELARTMQVHPLTLLMECFSLRDEADISEIFSRISSDLATLKEE